MTSLPLTTLLKRTSKEAFDKATKHPFLEAAGKGELPKATLSKWLAQDRLYALGYVRFIGGLVTKLLIPACTTSRSHTRSIHIEHNVFDALVSALTNIQREMKFFDEVAMEYGLDITTATNQENENQHSAASAFDASPVTRAYIDMFMSAASPGVSLLEGMTVLYATELAYLHAWRYAADVMSNTAVCSETLVSPSSFSVGTERDLDGGALRRKFIPNWSSTEFEQFVHKLGDVVDDLAESLKGADVIEKVRGDCLGWFRHVLWLERQFWPDVDKA